jgi:hypothetical protein
MTTHASLIEKLSIVQRALNDWLADFADTEFDEKDVIAARKRIHERGTIVYIANANAELRSVIAALEAEGRDAERFVYLVSQGIPEICMAVDGAPCYSLAVARAAIDEGMCPALSQAAGDAK